MAMKSMIIDFQILITNPAVREILTNKYIKRGVHGVAYTIGGKKTVGKMQKN